MQMHWANRTKNEMGTLKKNSPRMKFTCRDQARHAFCTRCCSRIGHWACTPVARWLKFCFPRRRKNYFSSPFWRRRRTNDACLGRKFYAKRPRSALCFFRHRISIGEEKQFRRHEKSYQFLRFLVIPNKEHNHYLNRVNASIGGRSIPVIS